MHAHRRLRWGVAIARHRVIPIIVIRMPTPDHDQPSGAHRAGAPGTAFDALGEYISEHGLKHSRQRERIAETFLAMGGHVSVEELVARVRRLDPRISVATVYRTMKLLADCGVKIGRAHV